MTGKTRKRAAIAERNMALRNELWPDIEEARLWYRKRKTGFTTIPRTMPYILHIMNDLSSGKPVGATYFTLWCHVFDESFVKIPNPKEMAFEAGFASQRGEATWRDRMKRLCDLGFIDAKEGPTNPYHYVLIWNPHEVIRGLSNKKEGFRNTVYRGLLQRATDVGAKDMLLKD